MAKCGCGVRTYATFGKLGAFTKLCDAHRAKPATAGQKLFLKRERDAARKRAKRTPQMA